MAYKQSDNSIDTNTSLADTLSPSFIRIQHKIYSIEIKRSEISREKDTHALQATILSLEARTNQFAVQAEAKTSKLRAELVELKLQAFKHQKQLAIKRRSRQEKIRKLRQIVLEIIHSESQQHACLFEQKIGTKEKEMFLAISRQQQMRQRSISTLQNQLCQVMPKLHRHITQLSDFQESKLENIYQTVRKSADELKIQHCNQTNQQQQKLSYVSLLIAETASQIQEDIQQQKKQRQKHRLNIIRFIQQTRSRSSLSQNKRFSIQQ